MDTEQIGIASMLLGAGRETKDDAIDYSAGILLHRKTGDRVEKGEPLAVFHTSAESRFADAEKVFRDALTIGNEPPKQTKLIQARITRDGVERFSA